MLVALAFLSLPSNAQEQEEYDCSFYYREALFYLKGDEHTEKDPKKAIEYLKPCAEKGFDEAQMLLGRLYSFENNEEMDKKAFDLFKRSSEQGNAIAMADLGMMYKYGRGCKLNFNKARKWFKKSAKLGNDKAAYSLGYLYLKGFGNITQNYDKAVKWFQKSEYHMSKYWLGVCYAKGYGVKKDITKANGLLGADFNDTNVVIGENISDSDFKINEEEHEDISTIDISEEVLLGKWKGKLIQLDWSENHIENKENISLEFRLDSASNKLFSVFSFNGKQVEDEIIKLDNSIYFNNTYIEFPHQSFSKEIPSKLTHQIMSADLKLKLLNGKNYLIANIEDYINGWNEKGVPTRLILTKEVGFENSEEELSDEALKALSEQEESFIKLYPNPFENDLIISYKLKAKANTKVQISDLNGSVLSIIEKEKTKKKGEYRYFFNGGKLKKGIYIVSVIVNNKNNTRIIVKK